MEAILNTTIGTLVFDPIVYRALLRGLTLTLQIAVLAIALSFIFGVILGAARYSKVPVVAHIAASYIEFIRNLPTLLLILTAYFVLGLSAMWAATIGLTLYTSAIIAEVIRGGLASVPRGQWEAARSQGMSYLQTMRHIVLPPSVVKMIPPIVSQFVTVIKDSSFAMAIGAYELMFEGTILAGKYWKPEQIITIYVIIAMIYFVINFSISLVARRLQHTMSVGRGSIGD